MKNVAGQIQKGSGMKVLSSAMAMLKMIERLEQFNKTQNFSILGNLVNRQPGK